MDMFVEMFVDMFVDVAADCALARSCLSGLLERGAGLGAALGARESWGESGLDRGRCATGEGGWVIPTAQRNPSNTLILLCRTGHFCLTEKT